MPWATTRKAGTDPKYQTTAHRKARAALLRVFTPGDPCCLCGHAMYPPTSALHADHDPNNPDQYRGLAHGSVPCQDCGVRCNVVDGAKRGNARSRSDRAPTRWIL